MYNTIIHLGDNRAAYNNCLMMKSFFRLIIAVLNVYYSVSLWTDNLFPDIEKKTRVRKWHELKWVEIHWNGMRWIYGWHISLDGRKTKNFESNEAFWHSNQRLEWWKHVFTSCALLPITYIFPSYMYIPYAFPMIMFK